MSKVQLKKVLFTLTREQLTDLMLEVYQAKIVAKDYLDFFVDPDIEGRLEKARQLISRELMRSTKGMNRGRITRVRKAIKNLVALNPGYEAELEIMTSTVEIGCKAGSIMRVADVTQRGIAKLMTETIVSADKCGMLTTYLPRIEKAVDGMRTPIFRTNIYKRVLQAALKEAIEGLGI